MTDKLDRLLKIFSESDEDLQEDIFFNIDKDENTPQKWARALKIMNDLLVDTQASKREKQEIEKGIIGIGFSQNLKNFTIYFEDEKEFMDIPTSPIEALRAINEFFKSGIVIVQE